MRRGPKPVKSKEAKPPVARKAPKDEDSRVCDLEKRLAEALGQLQTSNRERAEALDQQAATTEILRVISSSPTEVQPVFDALATSATRLCAATDSSIFRLEGDRLRLVAHDGPIPVPAAFVLPANRLNVPGRAVVDRRNVHVTDLQAEAEFAPEITRLARQAGFHTIVGVPLLREGVPIGAITLRRPA